MAHSDRLDSFSGYRVGLSYREKLACGVGRLSRTIRLRLRLGRKSKGKRHRT